MTLETELLDIIEQMKKERIVHVHFEAGLTDQEVSDIEQTCQFCFPPDLKLFLQMGLPLGGISRNGIDPFPNWRKDPVEIMRDAQDWEKAFYFDIENCHFWMPKEWGEKPDNLEDQLVIAKDYLQTVPLLIPIYGHRMLPVEPCETGNPVFSVWQAIDTIHYGYNLQNYLKNEFLPWEQDWGEASDYRPIRFWTKITQYGNKDW